MTHLVPSSDTIDAPPSYTLTVSPYRNRPKLVGHPQSGFSGSNPTKGHLRSSIRHANFFHGHGRHHPTCGSNGVCLSLSTTTHRKSSLQKKGLCQKSMPMPPLDVTERLHTHCTMSETQSVISMDHPHGSLVEIQVFYREIRTPPVHDRKTKS